MSNFYRCDRCKKECPVEEAIFLSISRDLKSIDLCNECYNDFYAFMKNEKETKET